MLKLALRTAALLGTMALAACGDGDDDKDVAAFVGSWKITMGSTTSGGAGLCSMIPMTDLKDQVITITTGTDSDLVGTLSGCSVKYQVNGTIATAVAGQPPCSFSVMFGGNSIPVMLTTTTGNITVSGTTATYVTTGNAVAAVGGLSVTCQANSNATATKQ